MAIPQHILSLIQRRIGAASFTEEELSIVETWFDEALDDNALDDDDLKNYNLFLKIDSDQIKYDLKRLARG